MDSETVVDPSQENKEVEANPSQENKNQGLEDKVEKHDLCCNSCPHKTRNKEADGEKAVDPSQMRRGVANPFEASGSIHAKSGGLPTSLPFGWIHRFQPTDLQIVGYFLTMKVLNQPISYYPIQEADIYQYHPFKLLEKYEEHAVDGIEWYFFTKRERKYKSGDRVKRDIRGQERGCWQTPGHVEYIPKQGEGQIGVRRILEYCTGGKRTGAGKVDFKMYEYVLETKDQETEKPFHEWALCKIWINGHVTLQKYYKSTLDLNKEPGDEEIQGLQGS